MKKNLKRHGIKADGDVFDDKEALFIDCDSCALCQKAKNYDGLVDCDKCVIAMVIDDTCQGDDSEYEEWSENNNPQPMRKLLKMVYNELVK